MQLRGKVLSGGTMMIIGYLLSPLSWWNDAFINLPLALAFAWGVSYFYKPAFGVCVVIGYWLTNIAGFFLIHKGGQKMLGDQEKEYSWKCFLKDILISLLYTALILMLIKLKILQPMTDYFVGNNHAN